MGAIRWRKRSHKVRKGSNSGLPQAGKMSQRLIDIAEPYLNDGDGLVEYRKEMSLASSAWNLSLFPADAREEYLTKSLDLGELNEEDRQLIIQHLRDLMARKEQLFPEDRRMVADVDVVDEGDSVRVLVASLV